jgi:hypothetical protein
MNGYILFMAIGLATSEVGKTKDGSDWKKVMVPSGGFIEFENGIPVRLCDNGEAHGAYLAGEEDPLDTIAFWTRTHLTKGGWNVRIEKWRLNSFGEQVAKITLVK